MNATEPQGAIENQPATVPVRRKKAKPTKSQRDAAKDCTTEMWAAISEAREDYRKAINKLSEKFKR